MKMISVLLLALLTLPWLGCGYGSSNSAAATPQAGVVPVVMQLVPNTAKSGDPAFTLTINGKGTNFVTGKQLTTAIPMSAIATASTVQVTVTNPGHAAGGIYGPGGTASETSNTMNFTIN